jgi:hypothetical protein
MPKHFDQLAKGVVGRLLEKSTWLELEHEVPHAVQSVDFLFEPRGGLSSAPLGGWLDRMGSVGVGMIECFSHTVRPDELDACIYKREGVHHTRAKRARKRKEPRPQRPHLWITSTDRPHDLLRAYEAEPSTDWPRGFWTLRPWFRLHFVVLSELPREPDTLPLRLLGRDATLFHAMTEFAALPADNPLERLLGDVVLAAKGFIFQNPEVHKESNMNALEQIQAMYDRIERKLIDRGRKEGLKEGREEGVEEGVKKGKAGALLRLLVRRFGTLPKNVTARVTRASIEDIDRWFDRAVDAATLDDVFGR